MSTTPESVYVATSFGPFTKNRHFKMDPGSKLI